MCSRLVERDPLRVSSQLVPFFVLVLEHKLVRGGGELRRLVGHTLRALLQLRQLVAAFQDQLVGPGNLQHTPTCANSIFTLLFAFAVDKESYPGTSEVAVDARAPSCCRFSLGPGMCLATVRLGLPLLSPTVRE